MNRLYLLLLAPVAVALVACGGGCAALSPDVRSDAFPGEEIVDEHDQFVEDDLALDAEQRAAFLADSADLLDLLDSAPSIPRAKLAAASSGVLDRYDAYLDLAEARGEMTPLELRVYRRTSALARELAGLPPHE